MEKQTIPDDASTEVEIHQEALNDDFVAHLRRQEQQQIVLTMPPPPVFPHRDLYCVTG